MDESRDREIAAGLRKGNPDAWHALYDRYAKPIWQWVARSVGPHQADVADIVQETFFAAARSARHYDEGLGPLWAWLTGIARNHVALHFRKRRRHDPPRPSGNGSSIGCLLSRWLERQEAEPGDALESAETAGQVRAALTALPRDYETLLVAKYVEGISVEQLAGSENSTAAAVRSKLARARQAFRSAFAQTAGCSSRNKEGVV
jgi:RNA polymerase sigma-70 factor, ECF subfamily